MLTVNKLIRGLGEACFQVVEAVRKKRLAVQLRGRAVQVDPRMTPDIPSLVSALEAKT